MRKIDGQLSCGTTIRETTPHTPQTMVQEQLCSLQHLMDSGYGRPFPRHGLQLLFWFANHCVAFELVDCILIMKLVSDCQPERGSYGFHWFGNAEELLPVMKKPRKSKSKKQAMYFEVGNLNTESYPGSANLPAYVRENYRLDGNRSTYNIGRIIIRYQVKTGVVETVYVTEHDITFSGRFRPDRTYQISTELMEALQSPLLDITNFLYWMGYYSHIQMFSGNDTVEMNYPEPTAQQMLQPYTGCMATTDQYYDFRFLSDVFHQQLDANMSTFSYDQPAHYTGSVTQHNSELQAVYRELQRTRRTQYYPPCGWYQLYEDFEEKVKRRKGGGGFGFSLIKLLLGAGALCLVVKCFSWLRSWCKDEHVLKMKHANIMLDYVY